MPRSVIRPFVGANLVLASYIPILLMTMEAAPSGQEEGLTAYTEAGCARCHSVEVAGIEATVAERMQGPDLGTVGTDHDADWVVAVVRQTQELDGGPHRARFRGSDDQLNALAAWLVGLP